ncbi:unnamed protein product, partial [Sphacelaria rigidula]
RARRSSGTPGPGAEGGLIMLVRVVCSCLRNLGYPRSRLLALNMLVACGRCCNDEARRKRLVPVRDLDLCRGEVKANAPTS